MTTWTWAHSTKPLRVNQRFLFTAMHHSVSEVNSNARTFLDEMRWLDRLIRFRIYQLRGESRTEENTDAGDPSFADVKSLNAGEIFDAPMPAAEESPYARFLHSYAFSIPERAALALAAARDWHFRQAARLASG